MPVQNQSGFAWAGVSLGGPMIGSAVRADTVGLLSVADEYWVYVIELDADALADRDRHDLGKGVVYVGDSSHSPAIRLAKHQAAVPPAAAVFKRMKKPRMSRLRMDLSLYAGPYGTKAEARRNEKRTHNRLVSDGYRVFGDRGRNFMSKNQKAKGAS